MPSQTLDLVREGTIDANAVVVLLAILKWRPNGARSCWCTNRMLRELTGFSDSQIHRALRQLRTAKMVERIAVPDPDPLDPRNHTGYRFELLFVDHEGVSPATRGGCQERHQGGVTGDTQISGELSAARSNRAEYSAHANIGPKTDRRSLGGSQPRRGSASRSKGPKDVRGRELDRLLAEEIADGNGTPLRVVPSGLFDDDN